MNTDTLTIISRDNPWIEDKSRLDIWLTHRIPNIFIPRQQLVSASAQWADIDRAHLLIGPCQAGKSTALWAYLASRKTPVLFLDCEQPLIREWCRSSPLFLADLEKLIPTPSTALFFEEVQHLDEAGLFIKGLIDRKYGAPIFASGSSSFHLGAATRESLAGRATRSKLFSLSLAEVCQDLSAQPELLRQKSAFEQLLRLIIVGGYPRAWLSERPEFILSELIEAFVLRDATDLHKIARPDVFRHLLHLLAMQVGNLVNLSEWASLLGVSRDTVAAYLEILQTAHVVVMLPPFAGGRRLELTSRQKVYLLDNGIRNQLIGDFRPFAMRADMGALLENFVLTEIWKELPDGATLHHWRSASKSEVDFVVVKAGEVTGIEVKAAALRQPKLPRSARSFIEAYNPKHFILINLALAHSEHLDSTEIHWITPLEISAALEKYL